MAIEIEKKFKLTPAQFDEMRQRLREAGAERQGRCFEINRLFSNDHLRQISAYVRVRITGSEATLTYKRQLLPRKALKKQIEIESEVRDPDSVERIILELGLKMAILYEKERETWHLGRAEVVLDRLPFGHYMEIEGSVEDIESAEKLIISGEITSELSSYPQLTAEFGSYNDGVMAAVFPEAETHVEN